VSGGPVGGGLNITSRLNEGIVLSGRAAYYGGVPDPRGLAREARRRAYEGRFRLETAPRDAEPVLRVALELMVDAFLLDRRGNAKLFVEAHRMGAMLQERFSCRWTPTQNGEHFENPCGVLALHSRIGLSPGGRTWGRCSICGAGDFQCDHVVGQIYDGVRCYREIYRWDGEEMSFTPRPRDPRCFRVWALIPKSEVGTQKPNCVHCRHCIGNAEPAPDDLDPTTWSSEADELIAETVRASRAGLSLS
jgi:hypothetical protein